MPTVKRVIRHVEVDIARGERRCRRDANHTIRPGTPCLTIQEPGTPFKRSYCSECALPILKQCAADLRSIRDCLYPHGIPVQTGKKGAPATIGETLVEKNRSQLQSRLQSQAAAPASDGQPQEKSDSALDHFEQISATKAKRAAGQ